MKPALLFSIPCATLLALIAATMQPAPLLAQSPTSCGCWPPWNPYLTNWSGTYTLTVSGGNPPYWTINGSSSGSFTLQTPDDGPTAFNVSGSYNTVLMECDCPFYNSDITAHGSGPITNFTIILIFNQTNCTYALSLDDPFVYGTRTETDCTSQVPTDFDDYIDPSEGLAAPVGIGRPNPTYFWFPLPTFPQPITGTVTYTDIIGNDACNRPLQGTITLTWNFVPPTPRPLGIDVSHYQGAIDWPTVKASNCISFAYTKATENTNFTDPTFSVNEANAKAAGIPIGAYHFAHPETHPGIAGADQEAAFFWSKAGCYIKPGGSYLMPMLDIEQNPGPAATRDSVSQWVNEWCRDIVNYAAAAGTIVHPVVYTDTTYASQWLNATVTQWIPWIAQWPTILQDPYTNAPAATAPWSTWTLWQYRNIGVVRGIATNCDLDVLNGTYGDLSALVITGTGQPTINGATPAGSGCITITWSAVCGSTYRIQYTASLFPEIWTDLSDVTASSTTASYTDCPPGDASRFYRVILLH